MSRIAIHLVKPYSLLEFFSSGPIQQDTYVPTAMCSAISLLLFICLVLLLRCQELDDKTLHIVGCVYQN